jgi:hypothetical protein
MAEEHNFARANESFQTQSHNIGGVLMSNLTHENTDTEPGYLSLEFIAEREAFFVDRSGKKVALGCGDDRAVTAQSAQNFTEIYPDALPLNEGYASIYGAAAGIAKNVIITGIVQYGPEFVGRIGGFNGALAHAAKSMLDDKDPEAVRPALHSAESNENNAVSFDEETDGKVGCAYAEGVGATSALLVSEDDALIRDQARRDQSFVFGNDEHTAELLNAHQIFLETATNGKAGDFAVSREAYAASDMPVMILAGGHTGAKGSGLIHNFDLRRIRSSAAANEQGKDFYNQDVAIVTAATLRAFKDYNLDPEILMRAFVLDSTPVRAVLASGDTDPELMGKLDPQNLAMGILGDPQAAIAELRNESESERAA